METFAQQAAALAAADGGMLGVDIIQIVRQMDLMGGICLCFIMIFSVGSWAVILLKSLHITMATRQTRDFINQCVSGASSLEEAYKNAAVYPDSPVAQLLREAYLELEMENWYRQSDYEKAAPGGRLELARLGIERVLERTITTEIDHLESYLIFLATTSNVCPFIGLFGTVWGIMVAFQGLGQQGSAALSTLAPGLSTALVVTVAGLFAAIPASVMYNYLANRVKLLIGRMDSFSLELINIIQKQLVKEGEKPGRGPVTMGK